MTFIKNNQLWLQRSKHGRDKIFTDKNILWDAACEYFQWVTENPLYESKAFSYEGNITIAQIPKMRAMTFMGLCNFLGISDETLRKYKKLDDFIGVIKHIESVIYDYKFAGAAAGLLNANIISRELGLKDGVEPVPEKFDNNIEVVFVDAVDGRRATLEEIRAKRSKDADESGANNI